MKTLVRVAAIAVALAACSKSGEPDRAQKTTPQHPDGAPDAAPVAKVVVDAGAATGGNMEITNADMPDDAWTRAAGVAVDTWREALTKLAAAKVTVSPLRTPEGGTLPYLFRIEATKAGGEPAFRGVALISDGALINNKGAAAATTYLASLGFPKKQLELGLLVEVVYITKALDISWLRPGSIHGFEQLTQKQGLTQQVPATVEYDAKGALLTLYRDGASTGGGGGGYTPPPVERLEVRFAADATFTTKAARQASGMTKWESFTP